MNCDISLDLTWSKKCVMSFAVGKTEFGIPDTKPPFITLSNEENSKLLKQLESGFKRKTNWNKYQSELKQLPQNKYLSYLTDPSFQGVNKLFILSFENVTDREVYRKYYIPNIEIKDYNFIFKERNFFDQPTKNDLKIYDNIIKIATGQEMITQLAVSQVIPISRNITS